MKKVYYLLSTMTAFLCFNFMYMSNNKEETENSKVKDGPVQVQHYDMKDYTIFINGNRGN